MALRNIWLAIWRLLSPWATRSAMRCSVSVRLSQPKAGRSAASRPHPDAGGPQPGPDPGHVFGVAQLLVAVVGLVQPGHRRACSPRWAQAIPASSAAQARARAVE